MVKVNGLAEDLIEQIAFEARQSEYVDQKSGVSARMTITAFENLVSAAERRVLKNDDSATHVRISDFWGIIPSITGKVELVYEGEQEGPFIVALNLVGQSIRNQFINNFPTPETSKKTARRQTETVSKAAPTNGVYTPIVDWFSAGNEVDLLNDISNRDYQRTLNAIPGLSKLVDKFYPKIPGDEKYFMMEFVLHGLAEYSMLSKHVLQAGIQFKDLFSSVFTDNPLLEDDTVDFDN